jgi:hypothetical protein
VVELAIVLPLLVVLSLYGLYFLELIRARLRVQEISRSAAWELSAYPLSDYLGGRHDVAFSEAAAQVTGAVTLRYTNGEGWPGTFIASYQDLQLRADQDPVIMAQHSSPAGSEPGAWASLIFGAVQGATGPIAEALGFNAGGLVRTQASLELKNHLLPRHFLQRSFGGWFKLDVFGGQSLERVPLRATYALIASDWHVGEGEDVAGSMRHRSRGGGELPSAFFKQVSRMTFFGVRDRFAAVPGLSEVGRLLGSAVGDPTATHLISLNYGTRRPSEARDCNYLQGYPIEARGGLNDLDRSGGLDHERPSCFDTAPFRDQTRYEDSLYLRIFAARGAFFMGCKRAQADNPASDRDTSNGDESPKVDCG